MMKERVAALFIGLIMILSIAGFAISSIVVRTDNNQQQGPTIDYVTRRPLTQEEKVFVLRTGRTLIESIYKPECVECMQINSLLESFASQFQQYVVFEVYAIGNVTDTTQEVLQIIGSGGSIKNLEKNLTSETLLNTFCEVAVTKPKECFLVGI